MPHHGMTPHISGTTCPRRPVTPPARAKYWSAGSRNRPIRDEYLVVDGGKLAGVGAHSYSEGDATGGSEEAARFKKK